MAVNQKTLEAQLAAAVAELDFQYWGSELIANDRRPTLRIYIDTIAALQDETSTTVQRQINTDTADETAGVKQHWRQGPTIDDCTRVSRHLSVVLDVEDVMQGRYTLEVSTPGIERLLFRPEQYQAYVGQPIQVRLTELQAGRRQLQGVLLQAGEENFSLQVADDIFEIDYSRVAKANTVFVMDGIAKEGPGPK